jgi:hypothetical protein
VKHCLGMDVLDQGAGTMARFVAPVTMLATGGCGQVGVIKQPMLRTSPCSIETLVHQLWHSMEVSIQALVADQLLAREI